jgi:hypothetical protein
MGNTPKISWYLPQTVGFFPFFLGFVKFGPWSSSLAELGSARTVWPSRGGGEGGVAVGGGGLVRRRPGRLRGGARRLEPCAEKRGSAATGREEEKRREREGKEKEKKERKRGREGECVRTSEGE